MTRPGLPTMVVIVIALVMAGYLAMQLRTERHTVIALQQRATALELAQPNSASAPAVRPGAAQPESTASALAAPSDTPAEAPVARPASAPAPAPATQPIVVMRPDGTRDPDPLAGARVLLMMFYGDIEKDLELTPEQMRALHQLTARGNVTPAEFEGVLGAKYAQFQDRGLLGIVENRISSLRQSLASSAHPLTDQQAGQLRTVIQAEYRRRDEEIATHLKPTEPRALLDYEEERLRIMEASDNRLIAAARAHLGAGQVEVMQGSLNMMLNSQRRTLQTRRARFEAGGSAAADPPAPIYVYPSATPPPGITPGK